MSKTREQQFFSADEIFDMLKAQNLLVEEGFIEVNFAGIKIRVNDKSAVGNLFQEWLGAWLLENGVLFRIKTNSQEFPDFLLHETSNQEDLLELKVFDGDASPNFDIANFDAYVRSLRTNAYRLDANYLIFAYQLNNKVFKIKDFWLKRIWEMSGTSSTRPIRVQEKQNVIVNIRPIIWYSKASKVTLPFESREYFIKALKETLEQVHGLNYANDWFKEVSQNYEAYFGSLL